mgnify:CR=1 FL=1
MTSLSAYSKDQIYVRTSAAMVLVVLGSCQKFAFSKLQSVPVVRDPSCKTKENVVGLFILNYTMYECSSGCGDGFCFRSSGTLGERKRRILCCRIVKNTFNKQRTFRNVNDV